MGAQIPVISEKPLAACGCRKFQIDSLGDHISTCNSHSGAKKAHDWAVDQIADLFRTTTKVKTQQVTRSRGQHCGDVELAGSKMGSLVPGHQGTGALGPGPRAFFILFYFLFWREFFFSLKKSVKKIVFSLFFLSFSLSFSLSLYTHFGVFLV